MSEILATGFEVDTPLDRLWAAIITLQGLAYAHKEMPERNIGEVLRLSYNNRKGHFVMQELDHDLYANRFWPRVTSSIHTASGLAWQEGFVLESDTQVVRVRPNGTESISGEEIDRMAERIEGMIEEVRNPSADHNFEVGLVPNLAGEAYDVE
ncbi:MAG TPA: hypothetical protein VLG37_05315 [Candidatus Saccharimonadales bacterium]|nr:hypothetical protein [Candidatus Saccharimonadales bacterium]